MRDVSGKEIAIYSGSSLTQWNIWGLDNPPGGGQVVGKIPACRNGSSGRNADATRNYYLKDHLGSIRVVLNSTNTIVSAQDYDACLTYSASAEEVGYPLENRSYNSSAMKYDFTGKERDNETSYNYFGARYYDSRIGRWGQVEPLLDMYVNISPYCYSVCNPIIAKDVDGKDAKVTIEGNTIRVDVKIFYSMEEGQDQSLNLQQEAYLNEFVSEANKNWNDAGKNVEYNGETYNVIFNFESQEVASVWGLTAQKSFSEKYDTGENIAVSNTNEFEIGVSTNTFYLPNFSNVSLFDFSGSHEMGHVIGLAHPKDLNDQTTVMSHNPDRVAPNTKDVQNFLGQLDWNKTIQTVKGAKNAVDKH